MEKTIRFAEIPQVNGIAFSDPSYGPDVWCQYRNDFRPSSGWVMKMESWRAPEGYVEFALSLGRRTTMSGLKVSDDGDRSTIHYYAHHQLEAKEIGIDTAQVYVGSLKNFEMWGGSASIYTAADGLFGELQVVTCKGEDEPSGFLLMGGIDPDITGEDDMFRTVMAAFDGHEIDRERFEKLIDPNSLEVRMEFAKELHRAAALEQPEKPREKGKGDCER